jgi:hypothetical protein
MAPPKKEDEKGTGLFPFWTMPLTRLNLMDEAFKKTTQMNRVVTIEQNKRNLAIVGLGILFIFCITAAVLVLGDGIGLVPRLVVGAVIFRLILLAKSALMWVGLKLRK